MHRMLSLGIAITVAATLWAQSKPAAPAGMAGAASQGRLSPMIVKNVRPVKATLQATTQTTLRQISDAMGKTMTALDAAVRDGHLSQAGAPVVIYRGMSGGVDAPFEMTIANPVADGAKDVGEFKVKPLAEGKAATFYYTGPISGFGMAYGKAFTQLSMAGLRPTGEIRELYLFWEDPASPNNVVEMQIFVAVPPAAPTSAPAE
jgi:effector-binding domain-containing protein